MQARTRRITQRGKAPGMPRPALTDSLGWWRRLLLAFLVPVLALGLSGCVRLNASAKIMGENEILLSLDYSVAIGQVPGSAASLCTGPTSPIPGLGWQSYTDGDYAGCRFNGLATLSRLQSAAPGMLTHENSVWTFNFSGNNSSLLGGSPIPASLFDQFHVSVTFPGKVLTHLGSSTVSGSTVTWTDASDLANGQIQATARDTVTRAWWFIPLLCVGGLILLTAALIVWRRRRRAVKASAMANQPYYATPVPGQYSGQQYPNAPYPTPQYPPTQQTPEPTLVDPLAGSLGGSYPPPPGSGWERGPGDRSPWESNQ